VNSEKLSEIKRYNAEIEELTTIEITFGKLNSDEKLRLRFCRKKISELIRKL
jgi:hypothetical protein